MALPRAPRRGRALCRRRIGDRATAQSVEARLERLTKAAKERLVARPAAARRWLHGVLAKVDEAAAR